MAKIFPQRIVATVYSRNCRRNNSKVLQRYLQPVELEVPQAVYEPNQPIRHAYFPESGMVSVVSVMEDGRSIEVGTIGREGVVGGMVLLHADQVPYRYFTQINGRAQRIDCRTTDRRGAEISRIANADTSLRSRVPNTIHASAACNGLHTVQQRCCRWLLMARDRCDSDEISLTHEFLAMMLGVRRASVTEVLARCKMPAWSAPIRGLITILNRPASKPAHANATA